MQFQTDSVNKLFQRRSLSIAVVVVVPNLRDGHVHDFDIVDLALVLRDRINYLLLRRDPLIFIGIIRLPHSS